VRILSVDESTDWLRERALVVRPAPAFGSDHKLEIPAAYEALLFATPTDAQTQVALAHLISGWFRCENSCLLVNVVALFQPYELEALLFLRRHYGDTRWVDGVPGGATPGHLFNDGSSADQRNVREFLILMLAFTFEGYFIQDTGDVIVWAADEILDIRAKDPDTLTHLREVLEPLRLRQL
jgi:hypothetical protein